MMGVVGCDLILGAEDRRVVGILATEPNFADGIDVPDTVDIGAPFAIGITTIAPTPCWQADGENVTIVKHLVEIIPYDRDTRAPDGACPASVVFLRRSLSVTLTTGGDAVVRVRGRGFGGEESVLERSVFVR